MWEFIAFVLFGGVMFCVGAVYSMGSCARAGYLTHGGHRYRVVKDGE